MHVSVTFTFLAHLQAVWYYRSKVLLWCLLWRVEEIEERTKIAQLCQQLNLLFVEPQTRDIDNVL